MFLVQAKVAYLKMYVNQQYKGEQGKLQSLCFTKHYTIEKETLVKKISLQQKTNKSIVNDDKVPIPIIITYHPSHYKQCKKHTQKKSIPDIHTV